jgi:cytoskeleton protein RodZ
MKVTPQKLEALESDRYDLLPDPTFARALSLAICRYLKVDAEQVMARLPQPREHRLEHINRGLATPFRDHGASVDDGDWGAWLRPSVVGPALVLIAALVIYLMPVGLWRLPDFASDGMSSSGPSADGSVAGSVAPAMPPVGGEGPVPAGSMVVEPVTPQLAGRAPTPLDAVQTPSPVPLAGAATSGAGQARPSVAAASAATLEAPARVASPLTITATRESWIEVIDGSGRVLLSRALPAGETAELDGPVPFKLRIGNAAGTQVTWRGQNVPLVTNNNIVRLELK